MYYTIQYILRLFCYLVYWACQRVGGRVVVKLFLLHDAPVDLNDAKSGLKKGKKSWLDWNLMTQNISCQYCPRDEMGIK